jgi:hypothetical protein
LISLLPEQHLRLLKTHADGCWTTIQFMLQFNPGNQQNPAAERNGAIENLNNRFADAISALGPAVAFLSSMQRSLSGFENEARNLLQSLRDKSEEVKQLQKETVQEADRVLAGVRSVAAEAGVSQQAVYFGDQAAKHAQSAADWQKYTNRMAGALGAFAIITWIVGYLIVPENTYQAFQFGLSKVLIFSTLAFMLYLCARTLMAHRHNEVVNRHRQNALLTFNALADAATKPEARDVVLTQASACIYAPQESGFSKSAGNQPGTSLIEIVPKVMGAEHLS